MTSDRTAIGLRLRLVLCLLGVAAAVSLGCSYGDASPVPVDGPAEQAMAPSPTPATPATLRHRCSDADSHACPDGHAVSRSHPDGPPPSPTSSPVPQPVSWIDLLAESFDRMREVDSLQVELTPGGDGDRGQVGGRQHDHTGELRGRLPGAGPCTGRHEDEPGLLRSRDDHHRRGRSPSATTPTSPTRRRACGRPGSWRTCRCCSLPTCWRWAHSP